MISACMVFIERRKKPATQRQEVYKKRGKERIPYPLFELTTTDDAVFLCESPVYNAGIAVMIPAWSIVATPEFSPQPVGWVAVTV